MITKKDSRTCQLYPQGSLNPNHMISLPQHGFRDNTPFCPNPYVFATNLALPDVSVSGFPGLEKGKPVEVSEIRQGLPPHLDIFSPSKKPYLRESQFTSAHEQGIRATPSKAFGAAEKQFIVFDQTENETRLFFSPILSPCKNHGIAPKKPVGPPNFYDERLAGFRKQTSIDPFAQKEMDDDQTRGEGSELREDTEEINALLYSDDSYESDDETDGEDDEVTSTYRSPFASRGSNDNHEIMEFIEEVASSDGSMKRQKLLDGGYKKSSFVSLATPTGHSKFCKYDDDVESSCPKRGRVDKDNSSITNQKKVKIHEMLRTLESIIPGLTSKNPVQIIDEAIDYLMSLKLKAKSLGVHLVQEQNPLTTTDVGTWGSYQLNDLLNGSSK